MFVYLVWFGSPLPLQLYQPMTCSVMEYEKSKAYSSTLPPNTSWYQAALDVWPSVGLNGDGRDETSKGKRLEGRGEISSGKRLVRIPLLLRSKASLTHIHTLTHSLGWGRWLRWGWGLEELLLKQLLIRKSIPGCASFPHEHQFPHRCFITLRCYRSANCQLGG